MKIILGSASPRRHEIFKMFFPDFEIISPNIIEKSITDEQPVKFAERMSSEKMNAVLSDPLCAAENIFAASADTIIALSSSIIGKPQDFEHAVEIIQTLSGRTHQVITGLTLFYKAKNAKALFMTSHEISHVTFKRLDENTIKHYLSTIHYLDKSGSYAIQENGEMIIDNIAGSKSNIIGFPIGLFCRLLNDIGGMELLR